MAVDGPQIGAPNYFEACIVAEARQGVAGWRDLDRLSSALGLSITAFNATHVVDAREAYRRFGTTITEVEAGSMAALTSP
jgi:uncharacterized protein with PIN domain